MSLKKPIAENCSGLFCFCPQKLTSFGIIFLIILPSFYLLSLLCLVSKSITGVDLGDVSAVKVNGNSLDDTFLNQIKLLN
jgi:hypothetical protein